MPYRYMDPKPLNDKIAELQQLLKNEQELNRQANDQIAEWRGKWEASTEGVDAKLQAIADAGARKSAPEKLDEAQGPVPAGDPASPHAFELAGHAGTYNPDGGEYAQGTGPSFTIHPPIEVSLPIESEPVGTDPSHSASSISEPDASSSPDPVTSTTDPMPESTGGPSGSSPTPTTDPDAAVSTEG